MDYNLDFIGELAFVMGISFIVIGATANASSITGIFIAGVLLFFFAIIIKTYFKFKIEKYTIFNKNSKEIGFMIKDPN